jgi:outer membrane protein assembly factor BamB
MMIRRILFLILLGTLPLSGAPSHEWSFSKATGHDGRFAPTTGKLAATLNGPMVFADDPPHALQLDAAANKRQHLSVTTDFKTAGLPAESFTLEAWVQVGTPLKWGGILSCIQDNGSYERGWLLGYNERHFYFGLSSESKKRITYLNSKAVYEVGAWHHVVATYDGKTQAIYVDGKLSASSTAQSGPVAYPEKGFFTLGAYHDDNEMYAMTGQLHYSAVRDEALDAAAIAKRYASKKSSYPKSTFQDDTVGWPTYMRDNGRTGASPDTLTFPLHPQWTYAAQHPPTPAWPPPAKADYWRKNTNVKPRVVYDRAFPVIAADGAVFFGSSSDHQVRRLDAATGEVKWTFFAEGPVRLAPTYTGGKLLFGSDDGYAYCINTSNASLNWRVRLGQDSYLLPGNERVISVHPVRTGVLVDDGKAYFCAGLFPRQGTWQGAVDIKSGKLLASGKLKLSPQGYLTNKGGRLHVATGRDPAGGYVGALKRRGRNAATPGTQIQKTYPYSFVRTADAVIAGGDGKVAAFSADTGAELWVAEVIGKAYSMAVADGRLFVSTDQGRIHCFAAANAAHKTTGFTENVRQRQAALLKEQRPKTWPLGGQILNRSIDKKGYCLVIGDTRRLVPDIALHTDMHVIGIEADKVKRMEARANLLGYGLYGDRAVIHGLESDRLPYTDYMFNLVVVRETDLSTDELMRVLRPGSGTLIHGNETTVRPALEGSGDWSHMYGDTANTVCSDDELVQGEMKLQWFGPPGPQPMIDRHHRTVAPLVKDGRLIVPGDNRVIAVDAYNGTILWDLELPNSRRVVALKDSSYLAMGGDFVCAAAGNECRVIDAVTGKARAMLEAASNHEWGFTATDGALVFGSSVIEGAVRRDQSHKNTTTITHYDNTPVVCSAELFAYPANGGKRRWTYTSQLGSIVNPSITISDGTVFFVEAGKAPSQGHGRLFDILGDGGTLVALDAANGKEKWRVAHDFSSAQHNLYLAASGSRLVTCGSRNEDRQAKYDVAVFDAANGKVSWQKTVNPKLKSGGSHGEQDRHPVIIGDRLYLEPAVFDIATGATPEGWDWSILKRGGCGQISASAKSLFFRQRTASMFDIESNKLTPVTDVTRPGCWINMIPAAGLLLVPEASSGCQCNFAVQTSLAFRPAD